MRPAVFLEPAAPEDLDALVALEKLCFSHPWTPRNFAAAMADAPRNRVVVLRVPHPAGDPDRGIAAYCVYERVADELHVHNLAVHPGVRRAGLARLLMRAVLAAGGGGGARRALLEVRRSNDAARRLYEDLGFRLLSTRRGYYTHPVEDALVMEKALP